MQQRVEMTGNGSDRMDKVRLAVLTRLHELQGSLSDTVFSASDRGDTCDRGKHEEIIMEQAARCRRITELINKLRTVLAMLESGQWDGTCMICEDEIPDERLIAAAPSTLCIVCQKNAEMAQKKMQSRRRR